MIRKAYVDVADGQMHYRYSAEGSGPPLVFFHMTAASSAAYVPLMEKLEGHMPLFAFDSMNYGESYRTTHEPTIGYMAAVMLEALRNLGVERFHTFGHHTGASIQSEMAVQAPGRVLSTILSGPTYARPDEMTMFTETLAWPNPRNVKGTHLTAAWARIRGNMNMLNYFEWPPHAAEIMDRDVIDMLRAGDDWCWAYRAVYSHDLIDRMSRQSAPMMFICGKQDPAFPLHARAVADFPDAPVHENDVGGVYYTETHPEDCVEPILRFLNGLGVA